MTQKPSYEPVMRKAETLVHRLDVKIDVVSKRYVSLLLDGFSSQAITRLVRSLKAVELQAEHNKSQIDLIGDELNQADEPVQAGESQEESWSDTLEALNLAYALSKDADDVLEDCKKLRELIFTDAGNRIEKTFRDLEPEDEAHQFVQTQVAVWRQPSTCVWTFELDPEPAESVSQFITRVLQDASANKVDTMQEAYEAYSDALEEACQRANSGEVTDLEIMHDLDHKLSVLSERLDMTTGLRKVMAVVDAQFAATRTHFVALASGQISPSKINTTEIEERLSELVFSEFKGSSEVLEDLRELCQLTREAKEMSEPAELVTRLASFEQDQRVRLGTAAQLLARAASQAAASSDDATVHAIMQVLTLGNSLMGDQRDYEHDETAEAEYAGFVRTVIDIKLNTVRSHLVFAAYMVQIAIQNSQELDESTGQKVTRWMDAELQVAGGDQGATKAAVIAENEVQKEIEDGNKQNELRAMELLDKLQGVLFKCSSRFLSKSENFSS
jgi:hypothetical protein